MKLSSAVTRFSLNHPKVIIGLMLVVTGCLLLLATLPSIWPDHFTSLNPVRVDTDPENMLSEDEAVRVFHNRLKREMALHDMVVLGVVNETHPDGVFLICRRLPFRSSSIFTFFLSHISWVTCQKSSYEL